MELRPAFGNEAINIALLTELCRAAGNEVARVTPYVRRTYSHGGPDERRGCQT